MVAAGLEITSIIGEKTSTTAVETLSITNVSVLLNSIMPNAANIKKRKAEREQLKLEKMKYVDLIYINRVMLVKFFQPYVIYSVKKSSCYTVHRQTT